MKQIKKNDNIKFLKFNEDALEYNTPLLFDKKLKKNVIKSLTFNKTDTGRLRHFTPAAQEWFNSIYNFNNYYTKSLPSADTNLMKLLKSYFNLELNHKLSKIKRTPTRYKRISTRRIFVGRGGLKHTNNKVIITFYVHNTERKHLIRSFGVTKRALFYPKKPLKKFVTINKKTKKLDISYNRPLSLKEYMSLPDHYKWYFNHLVHSIDLIDLNNLFLSNKIILHRILVKLESLKVINEDLKNKLFIKSFDNMDEYNYPSFLVYQKIAFDKYISKYLKYKELLWFNRTKFKQPFMLKLINLVKDMYKKNVEFNIVNLKKMHLNSDIFTQAVSLKLRDRNNKLYRVLKSSLRKIKIRNVYRMSYKGLKSNKDDFFYNKIRNKSINSMFTNDNDNNDLLNNLLLSFFPPADNLKVNIVKRSYTKESDISLASYVFSNLKHRKMAGIRVEAKGRLTRRFTASRSVFKMKWKGGLKNVDSSFKGWSALILRGHVKSNLQYSFISSKRSIGAFGVKGWVSNK